MRLVSSLFLRLPAIVAVAALCCSLVLAQQTLGGITGEVTDASGGVIPNATVTVVGEETSLTRTAKTNGAGVYSIVNLPIGTYTLTYTADGFDVQKTQHIGVQADRTATVNAALKVGQTSTTIEVEAAPLMNAVDTTVGYVMDTAQIDAVPLSTGSFTGVAILSPGVNAELPGGTGANSGLGNAPIWANGQRDTSNSFLAQRRRHHQPLQRQEHQPGALGARHQQHRCLVERRRRRRDPHRRVGLSLHRQRHPHARSRNIAGSSRQCIDVRRAAGLYLRRAHRHEHRLWHQRLSRHGLCRTAAPDWLNAAPFFFKQDADIPAYDKVPELHRYTAGGTFGGPIIKNKLFGFLAYQHLHVSDQEIGDSRSRCARRSQRRPLASAIADVTNNSFCSAYDQANFGCTPMTGAQVDPHGPRPASTRRPLPGEPGKWLIPNDGLNGALPSSAHIDNAFLPGTGRFTADLAVADLDYNASSKDTLAAKYYYQHDPTTAPYSYSSVPGFTEHLDSGAQVFSITNSLRPQVQPEHHPDHRRAARKDLRQQRAAFRPGCHSRRRCRNGQHQRHSDRNTSPASRVYNVLGDYQPSGESQAILNIGPNAEGQAPNTGVFQNRIVALRQRHLDPRQAHRQLRRQLQLHPAQHHRQANRHGHRLPLTTSANLRKGFVTPGSSSTGFYVSSFLQGNANRYYRANQLGTYVQDK